MAILDRVPDELLGSADGFTHYGWFLGVVPVYVGSVDTDCPAVIERNWIPAAALDIAEGIFALYCYVRCALDKKYEPLYAIRLSGIIGSE